MQFNFKLVIVFVLFLSELSVTALKKTTQEDTRISVLRSNNLFYWPSGVLSLLNDDFEFYWKKIVYVSSTIV